MRALIPTAGLVAAVILTGCVIQEPPVPEYIPPPPEDLSHWSVPALVQPAKRQAGVPLVEEHKPTPAEKVYDFKPGGTYVVPVAVGFPLDVLLEPGEALRNIMGGDAELVEQGQEPTRWTVKDGKSGKESTMREHVFIRVTEPGLKMGVIVTTSLRTYYLSCVSMAASPIRAVRWKYSDQRAEVLPDKEPGLLPEPGEQKRYHVGYHIGGSAPLPAFAPRYVIDDGTKMYIVYSEITLFKTVPLIRALTPQGPALLNSRQYLNVVIIDQLVPKLELRVGADTKDHPADIVTITQGILRTIECGNDSDCPVWPAAASALARR